MSELKPCPFCGGDANAIPSEHADDCYFMVMRNVKLNKDSADCSFVFDAIEAWSRRAQPAQAGQVLTDDALWELWNAQGCDDMSQSEAMKFARAIEAAVLAKRVPMTNAQIRRLYAESWSTAAGADFQQAVRAAEKFHGIVGEKGGA